MSELKQTKSSYEEFKQKLIDENSKLKQENNSFKEKLALMNK